jgi:chromosome segregation ATPase
LLDDLIGRQRLEDLASIGRELTDAHHRLEDLLSRYATTKDEALRRQLEREVRELRARIGDLARKIAALKSRNEVPDEWRNLPDTKDLAEGAKKLDDLLAEGDPSAMSRALDQLGKDLRGLREMLDSNAEDFGADRFPQENRVVSELMKKIGDLEGDERSLAGETQALSEKQEAETERRLRGQLADWLRKENEKVDHLRQKLGQLRTGDPESALAEEVERARESTSRLKRLFSERDLAEAKDEAERAAASLDRATEHLDEVDPRRQQAERSQSEAIKDVGEAQTLAQEIADDVRRLLPQPESTLSPEERARGRAQAERQSAIGDRTEDTEREAADRLGKIPGLEHAREDLRGAAEQMRQAAEHLRKSEAKQAGGAERSAAERLAKLRDAMQDRTMGGARNQRDPVRIPGSDESSAPRAWRQELLDAMKEKAPERFRDDVRRYYEELVR